MDRFDEMPYYLNTHGEIVRRGDGETRLRIQGDVDAVLFELNSLSRACRTISEERDALRAAATVPKDHVRTGTTDHKLLGTLPMTADGVIVGNHATLWAADPCEVFSMRVDNIGCTDSEESDTFWEVGELYSTREAAEAAREVKRG